MPVPAIGFIGGTLFHQLWEGVMKLLGLHLCLWLRVRNGSPILLWELFVDNLILWSSTYRLNQDFLVSDWTPLKFGLVSLRWINKQGLICFVTLLLITLLAFLGHIYTQNVCFNYIFPCWSENLEQISRLDKNWKIALLDRWVGR